MGGAVSQRAPAPGAACDSCSLLPALPEKHSRSPECTPCTLPEDCTRSPEQPPTAGLAPWLVHSLPLPCCRRARILDLEEAGVPVTNYGLLLAYAHSPAAMERALLPWRLPR
jgi:hypothetical protein